MGYEIVQKIMENFTYWDGFTEEDVDGFFYCINAPIYDYFTGASKLVLLPEEESDFVVKIPFTGTFDFGEYEDFYGAEEPDGWNYCRAEQEIHEAAKKHHFEELFLPLEKVNEIEDYPVYIQPRAIPYSQEKNSSEYCSKESYNKIKIERGKNQEIGKCNVNCFPINWIASVMDFFEGSIERLNEFFKFLDAWCDDLHDSNIGYYKGKPCLIDYGGFNE